MSDGSKGLLIKYGTFTLFLIIGAIMFFTGLLNGGTGEDGDAVFGMILVAGFMLSGASILFMLISLTEDF